MTVQELITLLREMPPHALVVRGDADWGAVEVKAVEHLTLSQPSTERRCTAWTAHIVSAKTNIE
jgi:hypothetical protein